MTNHGKFVLARMAAVNVAVASAHRAEARAEIRARYVEQRFAKCGSSGLVANQWREDVAFLQKQTASRAHRFLTLANVNATGDQTAAIEADEFFFKRARQQHPAKCLEKAFMWRGGRFCFYSCAALRHLKHSPILRKIGDRAQKIFVLRRSRSG